MEKSMIIAEHLTKIKA